MSRYVQSGVPLTRFLELPAEARAAFYAEHVVRNGEWFQDVRERTKYDWLVVFDFYETEPAYKGRADAPLPDADRLTIGARQFDRVPFVFGEGEKLDELRGKLQKM